MGGGAVLGPGPVVEVAPIPLPDVGHPMSGRAGHLSCSSQVSGSARIPAVVGPRACLGVEVV